ncbi:hypothetical protein CCR75_006891 [Bremia lactucae]|uniref:Uncharacterized protein n=1 Tax=Bremia lactucae TaxID=4779 RepID=A0A976FFB5_BRELC|nr:hypothetical protein CCR75_006891 [Bremia lactucae]
MANESFQAFVESQSSADLMYISLCREPIEIPWSESPQALLKSDSQHSLFELSTATTDVPVLVIDSSKSSTVLNAGDESRDSNEGFAATVLLLSCINEESSLEAEVSGSEK